MASVLNPRAPVDVNGNRSTPAITARTPHEMAVAAVWLDGRGYHREALMLRGRLADVFIAGGGLPVSDPSGLARASNARPGSACDHLTGALRGLPPYPLKES